MFIKTFKKPKLNLVYSVKFVKISPEATFKGRFKLHIVHLPGNRILLRMN